MFRLEPSNNIGYYINSGSGSSKTSLNAFDRALIAAGCGNYNLIRISSILPAHAKMVQSIDLEEGSLLPVAYAHLIAGPGEYVGDIVSAAVAVGIPENADSVGVIMEYEGVCPEDIARSKVKLMIEEAMNDRSVEKYKIICSSSSCVSTPNLYDCVFAHVAIIDHKQ